MSDTFFIDRRSEEEINEQIRAYVADAHHPASRSLIFVDDETKASYALVRSLNRVVRLLAAKTNLLDEKYFRFICDRLGLFALPPQSAVTPVTFTLAKGHDEVVVPKGTRLGSEKDKQVSFQTVEDLSVLNNSLRSITVEDHALSKSWKISGQDGDVKRKIQFKDLINRKNVIYRQTLTIHEDVKTEALQFLQFTGLSMTGVAYSFDVFTKLFTFVINGVEVTPVHFSGLFESGEKQTAVAALGINDDSPLSPDTLYVPVQMGPASEFQIEILSSRNLQEEGVVSIHFGKVNFFQFLPPAGVVINDTKIVVGAEAKHFSLNSGTENVIYFGSTEALSRVGSSFKAKFDFKLYWEGLNKTSFIFHKSELDASIMANLAQYFQISKLEYFDGVFWVPVPGVNLNSMQPTYNSVTKTMTCVVEFSVPTMSASQVAGVDSRWLRMSLTNASESLANTLFSNNQSLYQAITPWARITNVLLKKVVGDSSLTKIFSVGDFVAPEDLAVESPLSLLPARVDLFFELEQICQSRKIEWSFFADPQNKDRVSNLQLQWRKWTGRAWDEIDVLEDRTFGLTRSGKISLNAGTNLYLNPATKSYLLRLRLEPSQGGASIEGIESLVLNGVYNNTVEVEGVESDSENRFFSGTGTASQVISLAVKNVMDFKLSVTEPLVHAGESGFHLASDTKSFDWTLVESFFDSGPQDRHYVVDYTAGIVRFGDGIKGKSPAKGNKNIVVAGLRWLSSGVEGVEAGDLCKLSKKIPGIKECKNIYRATGYRLPLTEEAFYSLAPQKFKHFNRPVTFSDYEQITLESFSEVYSCRAFLDLKPKKMVKVVIVPRNIEDLHSNDSLLSKIDQYLISYSASNLIKSCYPDLVPIKIKITTKGLKDEDGRIVGEVHSRLKSFFDTVVGGQDQTGWQVGRNVYKSEISWAISDVLGTALYKIEFPNQSLVSTSYIEIGPNQYPDITEIEIVRMD